MNLTIEYFQVTEYFIIAHAIPAFMGKPDKQVISILTASAIIFISAFIAGLFNNDLLHYVSLCNAICGLIIIIYWVQRQIKITQHYADTKEIIVLCFEGLVIGISFYVIAGAAASNQVKVIQYIIFGIHLTSIIAFLIFMLVFKIKKLF